jgi:hypothetical protein
MSQHHALRFARASAGKQQARFFSITRSGETKEIRHPLIRQQPYREQPRQNGPFTSTSFDFLTQVQRALRPREIGQLCPHHVGRKDGLNPGQA